MNKVTGELVELPAHYAKHPVMGKDLQLIDGEKVEVIVPQPVVVAPKPVEPVVEIVIQEIVLDGEAEEAEAPETTIEE